MQSDIAYMVTFLVNLVVHLRETNERNLDEVIKKELYTSVNTDNPKPTFRVELSILSKEHNNIPMLISEHCKHNNLFNSNQSLILPICHMANYLFDYLPQDINIIHKNLYLTKLMIDKGMNITPISDNTYPFWRSYNDIFTPVTVGLLEDKLL